MSSHDDPACLEGSPIRPPGLAAGGRAPRAGWRSGPGWSARGVVVGSFTSLERRQGANHDVRNGGAGFRRGG